MSLENVVNVSITRQTTQLTEAAFGILMILTTQSKFASRTLHFDSMDEVDDYFASGTLQYKAASDYFAQDPRPEEVVIGSRYQTTANTITIATVANLTEYKVTIATTGAPVEFTFTSDETATANEIVAGLKAAIDIWTLAGGTVTATLEVDDLVLTPNASTVFIAVPDSRMTIALGTAEAVGVALSAIKVVDNEWYGLALTSRVEADVEAAAEWVETDYKLFGAASDDANIIDLTLALDTGEIANETIAKKFLGLSYARTFVIYSPTADDSEDATIGDEFPECAWFGKLFTKDPGSATWAFKLLTSVTAYDLTSAQLGNAEDKNANVYYNIGGTSMTWAGTVAGEYIDVIRGVDWLRIRMMERIFGTLVNNDKIPYTDKGIGVVEADIRAQLNEGIRKSVLASITSLTVPKYADISTAQKTARNLPDVLFRAILAGAIHAVEIAGTVTV